MAPSSFPAPTAVTSTAPSKGSPIAIHAGRCAEAHPGHPCPGDQPVTEEHPPESGSAERSPGSGSAEEPVECPECGKTACVPREAYEGES